MIKHILDQGKFLPLKFKRLLFQDDNWREIGEKMGQRNVGLPAEANEDDPVPEQEKERGFENIVCIDMGSGFTKIGYSGEDNPLSVFPTVVGSFSSGEEEEEENEGEESAQTIRNGNNLSIGRDVTSKREELEGRYPIKHGIVQNFEDVEEIYKYAFDKLDFTPGSGPLIITGSWGTPKLQKEKLTTLAFESLETPGLYIVNKGVCSIYSSGRTTGSVLTIGTGCLQTLPIYEGYALPHAMRKVNLGGDIVTHELMKQLERNGILKTTEKDGSVFSFSNKVLSDEIKTDCCYVATNYEKEEEEWKKGESNKKVHVLPDGSELTICGDERFKPPEVFFQPHLFLPTLRCDPCQDVLLRSIMRCDVDIREDLFRNIVLCGGSVMFDGFRDRLSQEIRRTMVKKRERAFYPDEDIHHNPDVVNVETHAEGMSSSWVGMSILGSLTAFKSMWMLKKDYEEIGPSGCHKKFF